MDAPASVESYLATFPASTRALLEELRAFIQALAPEATEKISYGIPTLDLHGNLVHYAGYAGHIGFYPGAKGIATFEEEIKAYNYAKGSVQFPLGQALPWELIRRIVLFRVEENRAKQAQKRAKRPRKTTQDR
jgi:uncharacterized protein YdhG (YjbR/CyaY superfamily)